MEGYKIGQSWWEVSGTNITKIILIGFNPVREVVFLDIEGNNKRLSKEDFKAFEKTVFGKRTDAVIHRDNSNLAQLNEEIAMKEDELVRLKAERDGING